MADNTVVMGRDNPVSAVDTPQHYQHASDNDQGGWAKLKLSLMIHPVSSPPERLIIIRISIR
ncbi:hypothetical protein J6590_047102 [Homalodisca vitripennis]|nr:hypothetical protein J6590_047102 [Homalodisca vitripennis]